MKYIRSYRGSRVKKLNCALLDRSSASDPENDLGLRTRLQRRLAVFLGLCPGLAGKHLQSPGGNAHVFLGGRRLNVVPLRSCRHHFDGDKDQRYADDKNLTLEQRIVALLDSHPNIEWRTGEVAKRLKAKEGSVRTGLSNLRSDGKINGRKEGRIVFYISLMGEIH